MFLHKSSGISNLLFDQIPIFFKKSLCLNNIFLFFHLFSTFAPLLGPPGLRPISACASMLQLGFPLVPSWLRLALSWSKLGYLAPSLLLIGPLLRSPGLSWALLGRHWPSAGLSSGSPWCHLDPAWRYICPTLCILDPFCQSLGLSCVPQGSPGLSWALLGSPWASLALCWPLILTTLGYTGAIFSQFDANAAALCAI
jgi:hypothetical protein